MNLKRSVRKSTRTVVACPGMVDIMPVLTPPARGPHRDQGQVVQAVKVEQAKVR
jgi:hypothetical protein